MRLISVLGVLILASACAPEPTTPSDTSLAGVWTSNAHMYSFSGFRLVIGVQKAEGLFGGQWTGKADTGAGCSIPTPCNVSGNLLGRNTISRVEIEILGAGKFDGALVEANRLRGLFAVGSTYDTITFDRIQGAAAAQISEGDR